LQKQTEDNLGSEFLSPSIKPSKFEVIKEETLQFPQLDIECLEIQDLNSKKDSSSPGHKVPINNFGISQIKNVHLSQAKSKQLPCSNQSIKSLGNITEEKTGEQSPLKELYPNRDKGNSAKKHFAIQGKQTSGRDQTLPKEMKENRHNNFSRRTFIPFQQLKPLKTEMNINPKIKRHKEKLMQLTNPHKVDKLSHSCSDDLSDDFQDDDHTDPINLNFFIGEQLNPHLNNQRTFQFSKGNLQVTPDSQLNSQICNVLANKNQKESPKGNRLGSFKFKDLVFICEQSTKYLKILQLEEDRLNFISKKSFETFLSIKLADIKRIIISEKDSFLLKLSYNDFSAEGKTQVRHLLIEMSSRKMFLNVFRKKGLQYLVLPKKSLEIESDDLFKNCSFNLFPKCLKQGFLELYVDDFFHDWRTYFVCLVDKCLILFDVNRKQTYSNYKQITKKIQIYRMISYNVIDRPSKIGLNRRYMFAIKILNENSQLVFSAYNKGQRKQWLKYL
jgi:hypothetical protein